MADKDSEYLDMKRKKGFRFLDANHDGMVTRQEFMDCGMNLAKLTNATHEETASAKKMWAKWCDIMFLPGPDDKGINEADFLHNHKQYWVSGRRAEIVEHNIATFGNFFDMIDRNKDGKISREELGFYYHSLGAKNEKFIEKVFRKLDLNADGYITKDEYVKAITEFWTNGDPSSGYEFIFDVE